MISRWILALCLPTAAIAQRQCTSVQFLAHFSVVFRTVSGREGPPERSCGITTPEGDTIRRVLYDNSGKPYFGYQFRISDADVKQFRVEVLPVKDSTLLSFSKSARPVVVGTNEFIDVTVLEKLRSGARPMGALEWLLTLLGWGAGDPPASSARMTDYLRIVPKGTPWANIPEFKGWAGTAPPGTDLTLDQPRLSTLTGELGRNQEMGVIGREVWLYREGLGRFLFSVSAKPGFHKTALVEGGFLQFSDDQDGKNVLDAYTVSLHSNALPMPGAWMIWVKHERDFRRPAGPWTSEEIKNGMLAIGVER